MTDPAMNAPLETPTLKTSLKRQDANMSRRNRAEKRFQYYGMAAIGAGILALVFLLIAILSNGVPAFQRTVVSVDFTLTQEQFDEAEKAMLKTKKYEGFFEDALKAKLESEGVSAELDAKTIGRMLGKVGGTLREHYRENPGDLGQPVNFELPAGSR